jgi:hypothetical protein
VLQIRPFVLGQRGKHIGTIPEFSEGFGVDKILFVILLYLVLQAMAFGSHLTILYPELHYAPFNHVICCHDD